MTLLYDVWLSLVFGAGSKKPRAICSQYRDAKEFYEAYRSGAELPKFISEKNLVKLEKVSPEDAQTVLTECQQTGISVITLQHKNYPKRLLRIPDAPYVLYVKGDISVCDAPTVAVVGTRNPGDYGKNCARYISKELAQGNVTVVSGGAVGIDSISHTAALQEGGKTVCVLGGGINCNYLDKNRQLRQNITQSGAVISEYPPQFKPTKYSFVTRNRIISALSDGVLVIEAGENSGALTTARAAMKQSIPVLSVPGAMFSESFKGSNELIKQGAYAVFSAEDVFSALGINKPTTQATKNEEIQNEPSRQFLFEKPEPSVALSQNAALAYGAFEKEEMHISELREIAGISPQKILIALSELELNGIVVQSGGGKYRFNIESR
ncbi:MAG: DNA-processing protein DprA [Clostridia bacterium]|nr:DNA-processing protein DprA [Clostridia bacterium]